MVYLDTARLAAQRGYTNIKVFSDGVPGWVKAGYPLDSSRAVPKMAIPTISYAELLTLKDTVTILDISPSKVPNTLGCIPGSLRIPMKTLSRRSTEIPKDKPIVIVDYNAKQSQHAGSWLVAQGYSEVKSLRGGLIDAVKKGARLEKAAP